MRGNTIQYSDRHDVVKNRRVLAGWKGIPWRGAAPSANTDRENQTKGVQSPCDMIDIIPGIPWATPPATLRFWRVFRGIVKNRNERFGTVFCINCSPHEDSWPRDHLQGGRPPRRVRRRSSCGCFPGAPPGHVRTVPSLSQNPLNPGVAEPREGRRVRLHALPGHNQPRRVSPERPEGSWLNVVGPRKASPCSACVPRNPRRTTALGTTDHLTSRSAQRRCHVWPLQRNSGGLPRVVREEEPPPGKSRRGEDGFNGRHDGASSSGTWRVVFLPHAS